MPIPFRFYVAREAMLITAFNATINAGYTWWLWRHLDVVPLRGDGGVALDLALTPVVIAVLSTLLGTAALRRKIADGRIAVEPGTRAHPRLGHLPRGLMPRAAIVAILAGLLLALPLWAVLPALGDGALTPLDASGTKVLLTVALSLLIVPTLTWAVLADAQRQGTGPGTARSLSDQPSPVDRSDAGMLSESL